MKVAIVHYWLVGMRGGEKVLEALCELFPEADIFTHVYAPSGTSEVIRRHQIRTSFIGRLPFARRFYHAYLPLMPLALDLLNLDQYDLVISSESGPAKGVLTRPDALHICYCHTPMRYAWSGYHFYRANYGRLKRLLMSIMLHRLREWDYTSSARVDHFVANSNNVSARIQKYYRRSSTVIYPPVHIPEAAAILPSEDFFLFVSQLVPYKRVDLVIEAFNHLKRPLVIIGHGPEYGRLKKLCGPNVRLCGWQDNQVLYDHYRRCRALVFIADEDFGIVPIEAMSVGKPVIALGRGGTLETVLHGKTGILFPEQTKQSLQEAITYFEAIEYTFDPAEIINHAKTFSKEVFLRKMSEVINGWLEDWEFRKRTVDLKSDDLASSDSSAPALV